MQCSLLEKANIPGQVDTRAEASSNALQATSLSPTTSYYSFRAPSRDQSRSLDFEFLVVPESCFMAKIWSRQRPELQPAGLVSATIASFHPRHRVPYRIFGFPVKRMVTKKATPRIFGKMCLKSLENGPCWPQTRPPSLTLGLRSQRLSQRHNLSSRRIWGHMRA